MQETQITASPQPGPAMNPARRYFAAGYEPPLVIAHRGFSSSYPENTLPAFEAAIDAGADMIEMDVRLTRDKRLALIHDDTLDRTTSGTGPVSDASLAELLHLDAGLWFDTAFAGTPVPTLEGALRMIDRRCLVNLELKVAEDAEYHEKSALACAALGMVRARNFLDLALFSSFDSGMLRLIRKLEPKAHLGVLAENHAAHAAVLSLAREIEADAVHPRAASLDMELVETAHGLGLLVLTWARPEENTEAFMDSALHLGADGFFANHVPALARAADRYRATF